ncbi:MAG: thioredoxin family protein [Ruminococcus sp.]|nr:thioredoxin family protein [Ruminococcus sp.]
MERKKQKPLLPPEAIQSIQVLGAGCKNCHMLLESVQTAVRRLELSVEVEYITDMQRIASFNIMRMPALAVNGKVVSMGRVLSFSEAEKRIRRAVQ